MHFCIKIIFIYISPIHNGFYLWYFEMTYSLKWILTRFTVEEPKKLYEESQDRNNTNQVKHEGSIAGHCRFLSSKQWSSVSFPRPKKLGCTLLDQYDFTGKIMSFYNSYFSFYDFFLPFLIWKIMQIECAVDFSSKRVMVKAVQFYCASVK